MKDGAAGQLAADEIISELIRNAEAGFFNVHYTILVPCIFNVYLHPRDAGVIQPVAELVQQEAARALSEHLAELNKRRTPPQRFARRFGLAGAEQREYKTLEKNWTIQFHADLEERLRPGEIEIYSELGTSNPKDYGAGAMTTFVTRHATGNATERVVQSVQRDRDAIFARLRFRDGGKDKTFVMDSEEIVIGRGGKAVWVDLKIEAQSDVSREHCRIRRDSKTGSFFIKDLSQFGTVVNGSSLPSGRGMVDRQGEVLLPSPAKIVLAGVFSIDFEVEPSA